MRSIPRRMVHGRSRVLARPASPCLAALALALMAGGAMPAVASEAGWRGIVKALHQPAISTEITAPVASISAREGERFKRGQVLIELDCGRQRQELAALAAAMREARTVAETNGYLQAKGAANRNDVEIAEARLERATAEWSALRLRLEGCRILAPFDGVVVELSVHAHELPTPGKPLMILASTDQIEIEILVPSRRLPLLRPGTRLQFRIDETGATHRARVLRGSGAIDTVSQTAKVFAELLEPAPDIMPGMSGTAGAVEEER